MLCKVTHCAGRVSANTRPHQHAYCVSDLLFNSSSCISSVTLRTKKWSLATPVWIVVAPEIPFQSQISNCTVQAGMGLLVHTLIPSAHENGEAPGTHCLRMRLISPRCGDSGLFSDSSVLCDVRVRTRYNVLVRIIQWRVMKVRIASRSMYISAKPISNTLNMNYGIRACGVQISKSQSKM